MEHQPAELDIVVISLSLKLKKYGTTASQEYLLDLVCQLE